MDEYIEFRHGSLSESYEEQANEQGYTFSDKMEIVEIIGKGLLAAHIHKCLTEKEFVKALDRFQNKVLSNRKYLKRLEKKDIKTDKKANAEYWDEIDDVCAKAAEEYNTIHKDIIYY